MKNYLKSPWAWFVIALVVIGLWAMSSYNRFVTLSQAVDGQWSQVEVQLQRRFDLIPNLVASVKGIFNQEKEVFSAIADARTRYSGAQSVDDKVAAAGQLESALGRLLVVVENYPQLRSSENVKALMDELAGTENRVSVERRRFNEYVQQYNTSVKIFPGNLFARVFGFSEKPFFQADKDAANAPTVSF